MYDRKLKPGEMREVISVYSKSELGGDYGEVGQTWSLLKTIRGRVSVMRKQDEVINMIMQGRTPFQIETWYDSAITDKMRVVWGSYTADIRSIEPNRRHSAMIIIVESTGENV